MDDKSSDYLGFADEYMRAAAEAQCEEQRNVYMGMAKSWAFAAAALQEQEVAAAGSGEPPNCVS